MRKNCLWAKPSWLIAAVTELPQAEGEEECSPLVSHSNQGYEKFSQYRIEVTEL